MPKIPAMIYADIGPKIDIARCAGIHRDEYGVMDQDICCFVIWIYSRTHKLETRKGRTHSALNEGEDAWEGTNELARGKFNMDMKLGSIAFATDNFTIQDVISRELQSRFRDAIFYVFGTPSGKGNGVLLEKFMEGKE